MVFLKNNDISYYFASYHLRPDDFPLEKLDLEPEDLVPLCEKLLLVTDPGFLDPEENERATGALIVLDEFDVIPEFERKFLLLLTRWFRLLLLLPLFILA